MHLMYSLDAQGNRVYTLKKATESGKPTISAHPARFSPDDKYSRHRVTLKKRYKLLPTQVEARKKMLAEEAAKAKAKEEAAAKAGAEDR